LNASKLLANTASNNSMIIIGAGNPLATNAPGDENNHILAASSSSKLKLAKQDSSQSSQVVTATKGSSNIELPDNNYEDEAYEEEEVQE